MSSSTAITRILWGGGKVLLCEKESGTGPSLNVFFQSRINVYVARVPAGTSVQNVIHWSQVLLSF